MARGVHPGRKIAVASRDEAGDGTLNCGVRLGSRRSWVESGEQGLSPVTLPEAGGAGLVRGAAVSEGVGGEGGRGRAPRGAARRPLCNPSYSEAVCQTAHVLPRGADTHVSRSSWPLSCTWALVTAMGAEPACTAARRKTRFRCSGGPRSRLWWRPGSVCTAPRVRALGRGAGPLVAGPLGPFLLLRLRHLCPRPGSAPVLCVRPDPVLLATGVPAPWHLCLYDEDLFTGPVGTERQRCFRSLSRPPCCVLRRRGLLLPSADDGLRLGPCAPSLDPVPRPPGSEDKGWESWGTGPGQCSLRLRPRGRGSDPLLLSLGSVTAWNPPGPGF